MKFNIVIIAILGLASKLSLASKPNVVCVLPEYKEFGVENDSSSSGLLASDCNKQLQLSNFSQAYSESLIKSNTDILFFGGLHILKFNWKIVNLNQIQIKPTPSNASVTISCTTSLDGGIHLIGTNNSEITGLYLYNCSGLLQTNLSLLMPNNINMPIYAALSIDRGQNICLYEISINTATTGICLLDVAGNILIQSVKITDAISNKFEPSGNIIAYRSNGLNIQASIKICSSQFQRSGNNANNVSEECDVDTDQNINEEIYFSGLSLFIYAINITIEINNTIFSGNYGYYGGNLALFLNNQIRGSPIPAVSIENVMFENGKAIVGGGTLINVTDMEINDTSCTCPSTINLTLFKMSNCSFHNNYAVKFGGGVSLFWKQSLHSNCRYDASIEQSSFRNNTIKYKGYGGLGIYYKRYIRSPDDPNIQNFTVHLAIRSSEFFHHCVGKMRLECSVILFVSLSNVELTDVSVENNDCTGILAIRSTIFLYGTIVLKENRALSGGGLKLCEQSLIFLAPNLNLLITNNSADYSGGGIFVNPKCDIHKPMCFFQFTKNVTDLNLYNTTSVIVKNNIANLSGDNLFGGSIDYCFLLNIEGNNAEYIRRLQLTQNNAQHPSSVSSTPQQACFESKTNCANKPKCNTSITLKSIYPGDDIKVDVKIVGQRYGAVAGLLQLYSKESELIITPNSSIAINKCGKEIQFKVYLSTSGISTSGIFSKIYTLYLQVKGSYNSIYEHTNPSITDTFISITFKNCSTGYKLYTRTINNKMAYSCNCCIECFANYTASCNSSTITKKRNTWIGTEKKQNSTSFVGIRYCPHDHCNSNTTVKVIENEIKQDSQCQYNRIGTMCGSCKKGWSLVIGSEECRKNCSNLSLLLIIPFLIAGILLVLLISYLNLTVTAGTVNGIIFYANILDINISYFFINYSIRFLTPALQVFLAFLNLDLGIPLCFYKEMGTYGKTIFQAAFPVYLWILALAIIGFSHRHSCLPISMGKNSVKVLATLLLLSYTKMLRVTIISLGASRLQVYNNTTSTSHLEYRWTADGNIKYFNPNDHIYMFIVAIVFIVISLPFTLSLLFIRHIFVLPNYFKFLSTLDKLKPFFDAYTGPYKDNARFWPGLLLSVRILLLLCYQMAKLFTISFKDYNCIVISICLILLSMMIYFNGVYKKHSLNIVESFFIANIAIVCILDIAEEKAVWSTFLKYLMISSALLLFLGILIYYVYLRCIKPRILKIKAMRAFGNEFDVQDLEGMRGYETNYSDSHREFVTMPTKYGSSLIDNYSAQ